MPLVSVIMVAHRDTPFLRPAIRSVLTQTWTDLELILVDNGLGLDRDQVGEMGADPRLKIISLNTNSGVSVGTNAGVQSCGGALVALLDSDDIALPHRIERQVAEMQARPELGLLYMAAETIDRDDHVTGLEFTLIDERDHRVFGAFDLPGVSPTFMCRREVMEQFPYRKTFTVAADYDFFSRVSDAWSTAALPEIGGRYRRYPEQASHSHRANQVFSANLVRLLTARRRSGRAEGLDELVTELKEWIANPPRLQAQYAYFAQRSLRDGFPLLAVYFARAVLRESRSPVAIWRAGVVWLRASWARPTQIPLLSRMFFTGPLRTFGIKPFAKNSAG